MLVNLNVVRESKSEPEDELVEANLGTVNLGNRLYELLLDSDVIQINLQVEDR